MDLNTIDRISMGLNHGLWKVFLGFEPDEILNLFNKII